MSVAREFTMQLAPDAPDIPGLIKALEAFFAARNLPRGALSGFALAFDEILTNIASYSAARQPIQVRVVIMPDEVRALVIDDGVPFDPLRLPPPDVTSGIEDRPIGGLGLYLVKKIMDRVGYERREPYNYFSFSKRIAEPTSP